MLRITISDCKDYPMYVLEGRLVGNWVQELVWITRELSPGTKAVIDIEHVHYVDPLGEKALHWLNCLGAAFVAQNAYGVHLCDRLELRRLTPSETETHPHKGKTMKTAHSSSGGARRRPSSKEKARH